ncbi:MAG TPA: LPD7 domain-containing protein, partial [Sphingomonas sp.]|nr:LPD7 domain-containing protein [Sphingomonas sp.]
MLAAAWPPPSPRAFRDQLARAGLVLATGDKVVVIVDRGGTAHPLARELRAACKSVGREPPRAAEVREALRDLPLPQLDRVRSLRTMAIAANNESKSAYKERLAAGIVGTEIVSDFASQVKSAWPAKGSHSSRVHMVDGSWLAIDKLARRVVVTGPVGQADALAQRLAQMEDYEVERQEGRRRRRLRALYSVGPAGANQPAPPQSDRFDYWAAAGHTPNRLADGSIAVEVDGTRLVDAGNHIEIHDEPPSPVAIAALVAVARDRWDSGLQLTGPWTDEARGLVWLECQRNGVALADYIPSDALVARWQAEQGGGAAAATGLRPGQAAAPVPQQGLSPATVAALPDSDEPEPTADPEFDQVAEIDRQIAAINR